MKRLLEERDILPKVTELGQQIAHDYRDRPLTILGVLTGSIVLLSDLIRRINIPLRVGLIQASSYRGETTTPGKLTINAELVPDITDRDVLLIDDIFDTGQTIAALVNEIKAMNPRTVRTGVLLWKKERTTVALQPDYHCFRIPNQFVVGYGLDYNDEYRHLPYIAALDEHELEEL